ncbi:MAG: hypothetical protein RBT46_00945 [Weeksellaceae bacterium]|jgi:hypothetical protein|nr:hypothetical protein [Weeksellaceae bacterium]MDX9704260.1 hypothetical protein [Weeksellaceae bacterium]
METLIRFIISNYFAVFFVTALLIAFIKVKKIHSSLSKKEVYKIYFAEFMLYTVGWCNVVNFVFHVFFGEMAAGFIGWEDSPFQAEVGYASLGMGIAGILSYKRNYSFRLAALIAPVVFYLGAAGGHIYEMFAYQNFSPGNVGLVLPLDIIIPCTGLFFAYQVKKISTN